MLGVMMTVTQPYKEWWRCLNNNCIVNDVILLITCLSPMNMMHSWWWLAGFDLGIRLMTFTSSNTPTIPEACSQRNALQFAKLAVRFEVGHLVKLDLAVPGVCWNRCMLKEGGAASKTIWCHWRKILIYNIWSALPCGQHQLALIDAEGHVCDPFWLP